MAQSIGEGTIGIPGDWYNASVNIFTAAPPGTAGPSVTVNRDILRPGTTLEEYTSEHLDKLRAKLRDFRLGDRRRTIIDGRPAEVSEFTWQADRGPMMHQILVTIQDSQRLLNLVATHGSVMEPPLRKQMMATLQSFRFA